MKAKTKYYLLKKVERNLLEDHIRDIKKPSKRMRQVCLDQYMLIEKVINKNTSDSTTNIFGFNDSNVHTVLAKYKDFVVWDYTGAINPIIHINENSYNYNQYSKMTIHGK